jgi:hypothetical protein
MYLGCDAAKVTQEARPAVELVKGYGDFNARSANVKTATSS